MKDWLRERVEAEYHVESTGSAVERVRRISARLQHDVPAADRLEPVVLRAARECAFVGPGRYVYIARRLLDRLGSDDAVAFVLAHELAHRLLGHVPSMARWWWFAPMLWARLLRSRSRANETAADCRAIELCVDAGYDPYKSLRAIHQLQMMALDAGDEAGVFGPTARQRRHPPLKDRERAIRDHLNKLGSGAGPYRSSTAARSPHQPDAGSPAPAPPTIGSGSPAQTTAPAKRAPESPRAEQVTALRWWSRLLYHRSHTARATTVLRACRTRKLQSTRAAKRCHSASSDRRRSSRPVCQ